MKNDEKNLGSIYYFGVIIVLCIGAMTVVAMIKQDHKPQYSKLVNDIVIQCVEANGKYSNGSHHELATVNIMTILGFDDEVRSSKQGHKELINDPRRERVYTAQSAMIKAYKSSTMPEYEKRIVYRAAVAKCLGKQA